MPWPVIAYEATLSPMRRLPVSVSMYDGVVRGQENVAFKLGHPEIR